MPERTPNYRFATPAPDHIMLGLRGDAKTSVTVTWRTDTSVPGGFVLCRERGSGKETAFPAVSRTFTSDVNRSMIHTSYLTGLKPGTRYEYTCGDETRRSAVFSFQTADADDSEFSFLLISDHQKDNDHYNPDYRPFGELLRKVLAAHPQVRFLLTAGDNTNCGQHEIQWNAMFEGMEGIIESLPYMMCCGNHDNRGFRQYFPEEKGRYYAEPAEFFNEQLLLSYPQNGPEGWRPENYSFDYGNAHFTMYGVNEPELVNRWSMADLDQTDKTWKIGVYHFPIYPSIPEGHNFDAYPMMRPCMERQDLMFSGHEHNFARTFPMRNENMYDRPSEGTIHYMLGNSNRNPPGSASMQKVWHAAFHPQQETVCMFALVHIKGKKLKITGFFDDGRIVDELTIDKEADRLFPPALAPIYAAPRLCFKGHDMGLAGVAAPPQQKDGVWFIPFGTFAAFCGGTVKWEKDKVTIRFFRHSAVYTLGSAVVQTDQGDLTMQAPVYRGAANQLYIPIDGACRPFAMRWDYSERNRFLNLQNEDESKPAPENP